jgi:hypothetical protein
MVIQNALSDFDGKPDGHLGLGMVADSARPRSPLGKLPAGACPPAGPRDSPRRHATPSCCPFPPSHPFCLHRSGEQRHAIVTASSPSSWAAAVAPLPHPNHAKPHLNPLHLAILSVEPSEHRQGHTAPFPPRWPRRSSSARALAVVPPLHSTSIHLLVRNGVAGMSCSLGASHRWPLCLLPPVRRRRITAASRARRQASPVVPRSTPTHPTTRLGE